MEIKMVYVDKNNKIIAWPYKDCLSFSDWIWIVEKEYWKQYYINKEGKEIAWPYRYCWGFSEWIWIVEKKDWKYYYINQDGKEIWWPYRYCCDFKNWIWRVQKEDKKRYYVNKDCKECDEKGDILNKNSEIINKLEDIKIGDCVVNSWEDKGIITKTFFKVRIITTVDWKISLVNSYPANLVKLCSKEEIEKYFITKK